MQKLEMDSIKMVPKKKRFEQQDFEFIHTPYETEEALYACVENGDLHGAEEVLEHLVQENVVIGRMSNDDLKQMQYWGVCCIALATRHAIRGGMHEAAAFRFSDECILQVDAMTRAEEILPFLLQKLFEITTLVHEIRTQNRPLGKTVRRAVYFIEVSVFKPIKTCDVAAFCSLSTDYLGRQFKKETGKTIGQYIAEARLQEARRMLRRGHPISETAYQLQFCSESYFIALYKKRFGKTPKQEAAGADQ